MAWLDFIKAIRRDEEEELERDRQGGFANKFTGFLDDAFDVGGRAVQRIDREVSRAGEGGDLDYDAIDVARDLPGALWDSTKKVGSGIGNFAADLAQSIPRGGVNIGLSLSEASRNQSLDSANRRIDELLKIPEAERRNLLSKLDDPEADLSDEDWSRAYTIKLAHDALDGDISDERLRKRKEENTAERQTHKTYKAGNDFTKFLVGGEEDEVAQSAQKTTEDASTFLEGQGVEGGTNTALATAFGVGMTALDAPTGLGNVAKSGLTKAVGKSGLKELAQEGSENGIRTILKERIPSLTDDLIDEVVPRLAVLLTLSRSAKPLTSSVQAQPSATH